MPWAAGSRIYEIGCAEADWLSLAQAAVPDATLTGVDCRAAKRPGTIHRGSFEEVEIADQDWVVLVSALEHIGLGHYKDPLLNDGDLLCLDHIYRSLRPGGHLYFDIPFTEGEGYLDGTECRVYDTARLDMMRQAYGWIEQAVRDVPVKTEWCYRAHWWTKPGGETTT